MVRVFPIHKGGPSEDPSNYRPISILPIVSKVIEKHVTKHLFAYLNKYKLLHEAQSGFRKHHSCQTALIKLTNDWLSHIDKGNIFGAIFFDLKKAFDVVDHEIGSKHMTSANEGIFVTINEHSIESVSAQKYLGITIDKNLKWGQQIDLVCRNVSRKLTRMKRLSKYVNQNSLKQYYN